jgi:hypothetical protein
MFSVLADEKQWQTFGAEPAGPNAYVSSWFRVLVAGVDRQPR